MKQNRFVYLPVLFMAILWAVSSCTNSKEAEPNTLTKQEIADGWVLLFDGKTTSGWRGANKNTFPEQGWEVKDGMLTTLFRGGGGDIVTEKMYSNFELSVDFKAPINSNSGIKYFVREDYDTRRTSEEGKALGLEYQTHDTGKRPLDDSNLYSIACLYELLPATNRVVNPAGEWNNARIVVRGRNVEHWLNGIKVLEYERGGKAFREAVAKSKFRNFPNFGESPEGHILLQDHTDVTSFRNIKIREYHSQPNLLSGTSINFNGLPDDENMSYSLPLIDFDANYNIKNATLNDAEVKLLKNRKNNSLQISLGHREERSSVTFPLPEHIDLSEYVAIAMDITNLGTKSISMEAQCFSEKDKSLTYNDGVAFYYRGMVVLNPGETDILMIFLSRWMDSIPAHTQQHFTGMFGLPGGFIRRKVDLDLRLMSHVSIFKQKTDEDWEVSVDNIRVVGKYSLPDETTLQTRFFPFIDQFGQYMHSDWPCKVKTPEDIKNQRKEEERDLTENPQPADWNKYGGWANGPTLNATGHFRMEKYNGKWWFVDPEGKLFWSQGLNAVTLSQRTRIQGREKYFSYTPPNDDFYQSNLMIKYEDSPNFANDATEHTHKRLRSWGMNTIAANSNNQFYRNPKTPYAIEIRSGLPGRLPEDFNAETFKESFRKVLVDRYAVEASANDPWCIGYFIDNEYSWPEQNQEEVIYQYFKTVREVLNEFAPQKLYLGCRSNSVNFNRIAFEAAAKYCDVISINHYDYNLSDFKATEGLDKPVIVGEFHFGALDRGMPHTGLRSASSQKQRARIYRHFVNQALESDYIVGTHWFQYVDQLYTARSDGENYQIGFVDICDRPHKEMIDVTRKISSYMYDFRLNGGRVFEY